MRNKILLLLGTILISSLLAACSGDSDDPTATEAPPAATATSEPTATDVPPTTTSEPTATATATPEPTSTPTPEPTLTATPEQTATSTPEPTATNVETPDTGDEGDGNPVATTLLEMLLTEPELADWTLYRPADFSVEPTVSFCNVEPFTAPDQWLGSAFVEYEMDPEDGPFLLQGLTAYPEAVASEAFDHIRLMTETCPEWVNDSGETVQLTSLMIPAFGDDTVGARMIYPPIDGVTYATDFAFYRIEGVVMMLVYLSEDTGGPAGVASPELTQVITMAIARAMVFDISQ